MAAKGQTKYKPTMPAELIEMFSRGKEKCHFCAKHNISLTAFDNWVKEKPEFAEAYEIGKVKAESFLRDIADSQLIEHHEGSKLNTKLWSMLMRNRFGMTEHRKLKMLGIDKAKSAVAQMKIVLAELSKGNLTGSEAHEVARLIETGIKVFEATELEKRVAEIELANKIGATGSEFKEE